MKRMDEKTHQKIKMSEYGEMNLKEDMSKELWLVDHRAQVSRRVKNKLGIVMTGK